MILRTSSPIYINQFIINTLEIIIKKKMDIHSLDTYRKDNILGFVEFKKEKNNDYIDITLRNCNYGYDFYNKEICKEKEDECCVCFINTQKAIACGHIICDDCISEIMKHSKTLNCPLCRQNQEIKGGLKIKYPLHLVTLLFNIE